MLEIHGKRDCPFAWRVRLVARQKGVDFEWLPYDVVMASTWTRPAMAGG